MPDRHAPAATQECAGPPSARAGRCSFCGKGDEQVERLIAGPNVAICNACVAICNQIIAHDRAGGPPR